MAIDELYGKVEKVLSGGVYESDVRMNALIALDLASLLEGELDADQHTALSAARDWWSDRRDDQQRLKYLNLISDRQDAYSRNGQDLSKIASINRLVFASLLDTTGLSAFSGEFLIGLAEAAGLSEDQIASVFSRYIPLDKSTVA